MRGLGKVARGINEQADEMKRKVEESPTRAPAWWWLMYYAALVALMMLALGWLTG